MASSSHATQPIPASMVAKRRRGNRDSTPEAQRLATGSMVGESECDT
jgi:hypothetical protein